MEKGIIVAGNLLVDYVKMIDNYPKKGMLANITHVTRGVGGCAANTLSNLAIIDSSIPLKCIGAVGRDENGRYLMNFLENLGIDITCVKEWDKEMTSFSDVMTVKESGERTFFHARGANAVLSEQDIPFETITADIFHIGYALLLDRFDREDAEYGTVMARVLHRIQKTGIKTSIDLVSEDSERFEKVVRPSLKYCNYFIANEIEGGRTVSITPRKEDDTIDREHIKAICKELLDLGVKDLVVIHAPEGGWAMTREGAFYDVPALQLPCGYIKGSVGAGDAFCAGMLYGIYKQYGIEECLQIACAAAAANLACSDSVSGMKPIETIKQLYNLYH
ncbi:carbohydrate kinase family protein [Cellulosilyticum sp. I15G10I2]|uniref:carbohydrate kinase family protein n=1 Tax=Cellulosilyticum sp. I15G10I2 TaxID=1892843 RepID=UPI00085C13D0|nr:carbohydrate kinase family protein [Cellulosilyticum sp. I15G10I2]